MADFNVGDKVIAIMDFGDAEPYGIVKGKEYIIGDIYSCGCGSTSLDVGVVLPIVYGRTRCMCTTLVPGFGTWWFNSKRFTKKEGDDEMYDFMDVFVKKLIEVD